MLSTDTDSNYLLQNINAENVIKNVKAKKQIISINKNNHHHDADEYISIGAWVPLNNSLILQQLKGEAQKMQSKLFFIKAFMNIILL